MIKRGVIVCLLCLNACGKDNEHRQSVPEIKKIRAQWFAINPLAALPLITKNKHVNPFKSNHLDDEKMKLCIHHPKYFSLHVTRASIPKILREIAQCVGINLVLGESVQGTMSLEVENLPWKEALDMILKTQGLDIEKIGSVLFVDKLANISLREQTRQEAQQRAKKWLPLQTQMLKIQYAKARDIALLLKEQKDNLLSERGSLRVDTRTNTLWLKDTGENIKIIKRLLRYLDVPVQQIMIEARIVDMTKQCENDLGIRWGVSKPGHLSGTLAGANQLVEASSASGIAALTDRLNMDLAAIPLVGTPASLGLALAKLGNGVLLDLELSALENEGRAEVIASPRLVTTNQQTAVIESGQDIPYQQSTVSGGTSVAFKKAVLSLKVTPRVTDDQHLLMDLVISEDADSGQRVQGVPVIVTKTIQTHVVVKHGETIVLGGIYKRGKNNTVIRVPFWGKLPILGALFRRIQLRNDNEELLIFITPKIISNAASV